MKFASIALLAASISGQAQAWWGYKNRDYEYAYCKVDGGSDAFGGVAYLSQYFDEELSDIKVNSYWYNVPAVDGILFKVIDNDDCSGNEISSNETSIYPLWREGSFKVKSRFDSGEDLDDLVTNGGAILITVLDGTPVACCNIMEKSWSWWGNKRQLSDKTEELTQN